MNFNLKERTVLLTVAGSRAYGMHTATSDIDMKGLCIPTKEYRDGFVNRFEQADKKSHFEPFFETLTDEEKVAARKYGLEGSVYDIRKFFKLAADNNPNILDALFCRDEEVRVLTPVGKKLRENRELFLSTKCRWTFSGYAHAQLKRIKTHRKWLLNPPTHKPTREEFELSDKTTISNEQFRAVEAALKKKMDGWEIDFGQLDEAGKMYIQSQISDRLTELEITSDSKFGAAARSLGYTENFIYMLQKEREYKGALTHWKQYQEWKRSRNEKRAELEAKHGYDTKHGSHLVRLLRMCREIMEEGKVLVYRPDAQELLAIRAGEWSYDKLVEFAESEDKAMAALYKTSPLPRSPDLKKLDALCIELTEEYER
jgi:predicted nucleotidyltransferase